MAHTVHTGLVPPAGGGAACCYGGYSVGETPGPIPNPEAKTHSADGTAPGRVWESRTPPDTHYRRRGRPAQQCQPTPAYHVNHTIILVRSLPLAPTCSFVL